MALSFETTFDYDLVRRILTEPSIYEGIRDDTAPEPEQFQPEKNPRLHYILVRDSGEILGLFVCVLHNLVCWEAHTCLLPHCRGRRALEVYREGMRWLKAHTSCRKVIGSIQPENKAALWISLRSGLTKFGINTKSILVHGELRDQILVGKEL
jgi:hypothetical protein